MTNQNNEFGKSPVKLSSPTQIWIDDVNQNNELDEILTELAEDCAESYAQHGYYKAYEYAEKAKAKIQALYAPKWEKGTFAKAGDVDIEEEYDPLKKQQNVNISTEHVKPVNMSLRQAIQDLEFYTKDGEPIDFIHLEHLDKIMELVNKTPKSVDLTKPEVNLIDIASPNMTPEASKVVSDAIERSAEVMNKKPVENGELRHTIHMQMLAKSESAKDLGELTAVPLGFAVDVALEFLAQEKAKWVAQMEQVIGEDDEVPPRPTGKEYLTRSQRTAVSKNVLRAKQRKALAKLLDKENTK